MALTADVTKTSVRAAGMAGLWYIALTLTVTDDEGPGFVKSFQQSYKKDNSLVALGTKFVADINKAIADYKTERAYFNSVQLDNLVTGVNNAVEV